MKNLLVALGALVSTFSMATSPVLPGPQIEYKDIVKITVAYGVTNTMYNPNEVLRPFRGNLLRISIPAYCEATNISQIGVWGRTLQGGQRVQLPLLLAKAEPSYGVNRWIYQVNGGRPATIREIGMLVSTSSIAGCQITFEQANTIEGGSFNECNENYACPAHIDNTRYCDANAFGNQPNFYEDANGADNSCTITARLRRQICRAGYKPSQYQISCR